MIYHQCCKFCKRILTIEEMAKHLKDLLGLCNKCREAKRHADSFKDRVEELGKEQEDVK